MSQSDSGSSGKVFYKSTGPSDSPPPDTLPSQNPAYTEHQAELDSSAGSGSSGSSTTTQGTTVQDIGGKLVTGSPTNNGGFISNDGTVYVDSHGAVEYGITDPGTGSFLPGGTTRVIAGATVYGTVQNGIFVSEDGTMLQLPNGFIEHGTTDASGNFLAETTVDGKQVWGNYGTDGSFMSSDGKMYLAAGSTTPEYGITDPGTGNFLPGGTTRVIDGQTVYGTVQNGDFFSEDGTLLQLPSGFTEHGKTDASGNFTAYATVDGKQVWGNYGTDGSFLSQDGTMYLAAGSTTPEYGITDPTTGSFLPNGAVRTIDGQTVYGQVLSSGDFISEDGTILQLPSGFTEHGKTDASGNFIAEMTINGQQVWGNYGTDGSFMSSDGTIYVPPGKPAEFGITDPQTNSFLPGGTSYTLPNGTILYGYSDAGGFWSYDGSTIVLSNGTVVNGSLQKGDGIFTGNNGNDYFVGQNGIVQVTPNSDGSFTMPDGSVVMTPQSWKTDLGLFQQAQNQIGTYISNISDDYSTIQMQYSLVESFWQSPAGTSFADATSAVDLAMQQLNTVLSSITSAMQTSYNNYYASEQQAIATFNANSSS